MLSMLEALKDDFEKAQEFVSDKFKDLSGVIEKFIEDNGGKEKVLEDVDNNVHQAISIIEKIAPVLSESTADTSILGWVCDHLKDLEEIIDALQDIK